MRSATSTRRASAFARRTAGSGARRSCRRSRCSAPRRRGTASREVRLAEQPERVGVGGRVIGNSSITSLRTRGARVVLRADRGAPRRQALLGRALLACDFWTACWIAASMFGGVVRDLRDSPCTRPSASRVSRHAPSPRGPSPRKGDGTREPRGAHAEAPDHLPVPVRALPGRDGAARGAVGRAAAASMALRPSPLLDRGTLIEWRR